METKICGKCKRTLPATQDYFNKDKKRADGLQPYCNDCRKQYRIENADAIKASNRKYYQNNKKIIEEKKRAYNEKNADAIKEWKRKWYEQNIDAIRVQSKKYYEKNKDAIKLRAQEYREKNPDLIKEYREKNREVLNKRRREKVFNDPILREKRKKQSKEWREKNKELIKVYREKPEVKEMRRRDNQIRRAREKNAPATLSIAQWIKCKKHFGYSCAYCGKKAKKFHQDHFTPVVAGGNYTISNIVPACKKCNESKNARSFFDWYPEQPFYSKQREKRILKYLYYVEPGKQQSSIFEIEQIVEA